MFRAFHFVKFHNFHYICLLTFIFPNYTEVHRIFDRYEIYYCKSIIEKAIEACVSFMSMYTVQLTKNHIPGCVHL